MRVVMFWEGGAYVSTLDHEFEKRKKELTEQFGPSCFATVRYHNDGVIVKDVDGVRTVTDNR